VSRLLVAATLLSALGAGRAARADTPASFALVIGVNRSMDSDARPLRYADDDAARYRDLFQALGVSTYLLATLDENTRRLHARAAAEARPPRAEELRLVVDRLVVAATRARAAGRPTTLYVVYAGHGNADSGAAYISLEDRRLTGAELASEVFDRVGAEREHLIVDACSSYLFVAGRGQGGERRPLRGFARPGGELLGRRNLGLLLSTSSARESHEWNAFQAGVFSHEVRSGMFGAADADGDGTVAYAEIAAFIRRANEAIPNERYRPEVFWRPPGRATTLIDLRSALARRVEIPASAHGHYYLEDPFGVRLADFHNSAAATVRLLRPGEADRLYLQRADDQRSYVLPGSVAVLDTSQLVPEDAPVGVRSAAHEAFGVLFSLPFDGAAVARTRPPPPEDAGDGGTTDAASLRRTVGWSFLGASALATAAATGALWSARRIHEQIGPTTTNLETDAQNQRIATGNRLGGALFGLAGATAVVGATLLLWPDSPLQLGLAATGDGASLGWAGRF
jgi:hypothetical protein